MRPFWLNALLAIAAIWLVGGGIMWWAKSSTPTPESISAYLEAHSLDGRNPKDRARVMEKVARQLNSLSYQQRRQVRLSRRLDGFFRSLTPEEQGRFLDLTLPEGFRQMMDALNKMEREQRQRFVNRALEDLKREEGAEIPPEARERLEQDGNFKRIVEQGLKSFYSEANNETKMDVAPLIEQMQRNLQSLR
jgi:DNA invertase Pin-like site-specific DNA recombinase